jgi:hypothetical protein
VRARRPNPPARTERIHKRQVQKSFIPIVLARIGARA